VRKRLHLRRDMLLDEVIGGFGQDDLTRCSNGLDPIRQIDSSSHDTILGSSGRADISTTTSPTWRPMPIEAPATPEFCFRCVLGEIFLHFRGALKSLWAERATLPPKAQRRQEARLQGNPR